MEAPSLELFLGDYKILEEATEHPCLRRLNTEDQCFSPQPPPSTSAVAGDADRRRGMAFMCSSGVPLLHSPECPWINPPSSFVSKERSWSEISLVVITSAITQCLLNGREPFVTCTQSDILPLLCNYIQFWKHLSRVTILLTNTRTKEH